LEAHQECKADLNTARALVSMEADPSTDKTLSTAVVHSMVRDHQDSTIKAALSMVSPDKVNMELVPSIRKDNTEAERVDHRALNTEAAHKVHNMAAVLNMDKAPVSMEAAVVLSMDKVPDNTEAVLKAAALVHNMARVIQVNPDKDLNMVNTQDNMEQE